MLRVPLDPAVEAPMARVLAAQAEDARVSGLRRRTMLDGKVRFRSYRLRDPGTAFITTSPLKSKLRARRSLCAPRFADVDSDEDDDTQRTPTISALTKQTNLLSLVEAEDAEGEAIAYGRPLVSTPAHPFPAAS